MKLGCQSRLYRRPNLSHNALMADKRKTTDRHKPSRTIRLNLRLAEQLALVAEHNATSLNQEANRAVRELLVREGLWPPKGDR